MKSAEEIARKYGGVPVKQEQSDAAAIAAKYGGVPVAQAEAPSAEFADVKGGTSSYYGGIPEGPRLDAMDPEKMSGDVMRGFFGVPRGVVDTAQLGPLIKDAIVGQLNPLTAASAPWRRGASMAQGLVSSIMNAPSKLQSEDLYEKGEGLAGVAAAIPAARLATGAGKAAFKAAIPETLPARLYESALKPGPRTHSLEEVKRMISTGLKQEIPVSESGFSRLKGLVDALNQDIASKVSSAKDVKISPVAAASRINKLAKQVKEQTNPVGDLRAVGASKKEFLGQHSTPGQKAVYGADIYGSDPFQKVLLKPATQTKYIPMSASEAQAIKQGTYRSLGDKAYGELKGASIEAQKAIARGLKEELADAIPEIRQLNLSESELLQLAPELEAAVNRIKNKEMIGIGTPILGGAAAAATGRPSVGVMAGILRALIDRPALKSKLAIALEKARH